MRIVDLTSSFTEEEYNHLLEMMIRERNYYQSKLWVAGCEERYNLACKIVEKLKKGGGYVRDKS